jgi:hypothetical protein
MKVLDKNVDIELYPATVLQIDKYARTGLFTDNRFFPLNMNTMYNDVVFQLQDTGKTLPLEIKDVQLPLYNKQAVDIISVNKYIIGYVDVKNEEYYYITDDFCKVIGFRFLGLLVWMAGLLVAFITFTFAKNNYAAMFSCILIIVTWCMHIIIASTLNRKIERSIDKFMGNFSLV